MSPSFQNQFKAPQGLKLGSLAANGCYLTCKSLPYYLHILYRSTCIYPSVSKVHAGCFSRVSVIHRNSDMDLQRAAYVIILVRAYAHGGWAHRQRVSRTCLTRNNYLEPKQSVVPSNVWIIMHCDHTESTGNTLGVLKTAFVIGC